MQKFGAHDMNDTLLFHQFLKPIKVKFIKLNRCYKINPKLGKLKNHDFKLRMILDDSYLLKISEFMNQIDNIEKKMKIYERNWMNFMNSNEKSQIKLH